MSIFDGVDQFCEIITVDDRPTSGGGLPDFWQVSMAHLIGTITRNSNIDKIIVIGNKSNAKHIVAILDQLSSSFYKSDDGYENIVNKLYFATAHKREVVKNFVDKIICGEIEIVFCDDDPDMVISQIYKSCQVGKSYWRSVDNKDSSENGLFHRKLDSTDFNLPLYEGIKCETAAHAYPIMVETLRAKKNEQNLRYTYDKLSIKLREIIGFKLVLTDPLQEVIPRYWWDEKSEFEKYASTVLLNKTGLLGEKLYEHGQYDIFIKHLSKQFLDKNSKKPSTRRAILIVPNILDEKENIPKPLGLVSVWATPRYSKEIFFLDFCFVWRTVEALVGFPYSLFGSIKFSEQATNKINDTLKQENFESNVIKVGQLTYLALSLHMSDNEYHDRIAKKIVDQASI